MYKGLARLVGMDVLDAGETLDDQIARSEASGTQYDFFFLHFKYTDSTGEDGNFAEKVEMIEKLDAAIPGILGSEARRVHRDRRPQHAEQAEVALAGTRCRRCCGRPRRGPDAVTEFSEAGLPPGGLGQFQAKHLMPLAMAHATRFGKYGMKPLAASRSIATPQAARFNSVRLPATAARSPRSPAGFARPS